MTTRNRTGKRPSAGALCRERGWGPGTVITSDRWTHPRQIEYVGPKQIQLAFTHTSNRVYVSTLPQDVRVDG